MAITFLIGLPCSGKSTYLSHLRDAEIIDDPTSYDEVIKTIENTKSKDIWISDAHFCNSKILDLADTKLLERFWTKHNFDRIYFENNPSKCLDNLRLRVSTDDNRKVENFIKSYSKIYEPNKWFKVIKVGELPKEKKLKNKKLKYSELTDLDKECKFSIEEFTSCVLCGGFTNYDGFGYYGLADSKSNIFVGFTVNEINFNKGKYGFTHVYWYNK